jgi:hypothetical protein
MIGQTALSLSHDFPQKILRTCLDLGNTVSSSLDFANIINLNSKVVSLASNLKPAGPGPCINPPSLPKVTGLSSYVLRHLLSTTHRVMVEVF